MAGIGVARLLGGGSEIYGSKPAVPLPVDYTKDIKEAIATNKSILPELSVLAKLSTEALLNVMESAFPGTKDIISTGGKAISSMVRGELPGDLRRKIDTDIATSGISGGTYGSDFDKYRGVLGRGKTSFDLIQRGLDSATQWINQAQNLSFDFSKFFLGKEDAMRRTEFNWQRDWLASQVKAAPDPGARGEFDSEMTAIGMNLSAYSGGQGYNGTYRPSYTPPNSGNPGNRDSYFGNDANYTVNENPGGAGYSEDFYNYGPQ